MTVTQSGHTWSCVAANALAAHHRRAAFLTHLRNCGEESSDFSAAAVIYGELVGNVVRHTRGGVEVWAGWKQSKAVLRVRDFGAGFYNDFRLPPVMSESGRGLYLVNQLAEDLDVSCDPTGCEVSAVLPVIHRCFR